MEKTTKWGASRLLFLSKQSHYSAYQINEDELDEAFGTNGKKKLPRGFLVESLKQGDRLEDLGVGRMIILKCILHYTFY
jgi:hypothetical protein